MESKFFAEAISRRRIDAGLTQEGLAQKAGLNRTTYGNIERGKSPLSIEHLVRLAIALETRVEEILAEAFQVHYMAVVEVQRRMLAEMGVKEPEGEKTASQEPKAAIDALVHSLRDFLMVMTVARKEPAAGLFAPMPNFSPPAPTLPRRRARAGKPRAPRRR